jgi:2-dehydropantoate 2-reductase
MLYILGAGAIGLFHAHHFAKRFPNQVVLLKKKCELRTARIKINTLDKEQEYSDCFVESIGESNRPIQHLLIATRAYDVLPALESIQHRVRHSNILLLTNGVLQVEKEIEHYSKPFLGFTTHGVIRNDEFEITHSGQGETWICPPPELANVLDKAWKSISYHSTTSDDMRIRALKKVAINACINPLTALWDCRNGHLVTPEAQEAIRVLAEEICTVVDLDPSALVEAVQLVAKNTRKNKNSMLVDVENNRKTEIDYMNGYFCRLAIEKGVQLPVHSFLTKCIHARIIDKENRIF